MTHEERWLRSELEPLERANYSDYSLRLQRHFAHRERMLRNILQIVLHGQETARQCRRSRGTRWKHHG